MHEMAVTQHLLNMALEYAEGRRVTDIYLEVGTMSAIVPSSVAIFFRYLAEDSLAEGAELHFEMVPMEMTCQSCGEKLDLSAWQDLRPHAIMGKAFQYGCEHCGSKNLQVTEGVRFEMVSLEVVESDGSDVEPEESEAG